MGLQLCADNHEKKGIRTLLKLICSATTFSEPQGPLFLLLIDFNHRIYLSLASTPNYIVLGDPLDPSHGIWGWCHPARCFQHLLTRNTYFTFIGCPGQRNHGECKLCVERYIFSLSVYKHRESSSSPTRVGWAQNLSALKNTLLIYKGGREEIARRRKQKFN